MTKVVSFCFSKHGVYFRSLPFEFSPVKVKLLCFLVKEVPSSDCLHNIF